MHSSINVIQTMSMIVTLEGTCFPHPTDFFPPPMEMVGSFNEKTCWVSQSNPYTHSLYHMMIFDRNFGFLSSLCWKPRLLFV